MPDRPRRPRRSKYDDRFSLHPLTFEQAVRALVGVGPVDEPPVEIPDPQGIYQADLDDLRDAESRIKGGLMDNPDEDPAGETVDDAADIRRFIEDERYRFNG